LHLLDIHGLIELLIELMNMEHGHSVHSPAMKALNNLCKGSLPRQEKTALADGLSAIYGCIISNPSLKPAGTQLLCNLSITSPIILQRLKKIGGIQTILDLEITPKTMEFVV
jgi:hypothetical protein